MLACAVVGEPRKSRKGTKRPAGRARWSERRGQRSRGGEGGRLATKIAKNAKVGGGLGEDGRLGEGGTGPPLGFDDGRVWCVGLIGGQANCAW